MLFVPALLTAHPHMQFSSTAEFVWKGRQLSGVFLEWRFDPFFSADIIRGYDLDRDGRFNDEETGAVYDGAFSNLRNYYYFTFISQGKRRETPKKIEQFSVRQEEGILYYRFFISLAGWSSGPLRLAVYDYTFFCDIRYPDKNPVRMRFDESQVHPSWEIRENKDNPVYYNPLGTVDDTTIYYEWKPGLETYYPREIRIQYE